jgi:hypothetical protein
MEDLSEKCTGACCTRRFEYDEKYSRMLDYYYHLMTANYKFQSIADEAHANTEPFVPFEIEENFSQVDFKPSYDALCHSCFFELKLKKEHKTFLRWFSHNSVKKLPEATFLDIIKLPEH